MGQYYYDIIFAILLLQFHLSASFLRPTFTSRHAPSSLSMTSSSSPTIPQLKSQLIASIINVRRLQSRDGSFSVDFGTKGGELDKKSRRPTKLDFYTISPSVGEAADKVFETVEALASLNPTPNATAFFKSKAEGEKSPIDGTWNLLFSTAADATFSSNSTRGAAKPSNVVEARRGKITNVIRFASNEDGSRKLVDMLRVRISARTEGARRFILTFKYACIHFTRLFFIPLRWRLYIPVPGPFLTKLIFTVMGRRKEIPQPYFDVQYLDSELRIHKTGEDNLFIQAKETWVEGMKTIEDME